VRLKDMLLFATIVIVFAMVFDFLYFPMFVLRQGRATLGMRPGQI